VCAEKNYVCVRVLSVYVHPFLVGDGFTPTTGYSLMVMFYSSSAFSTEPLLLKKETNDGEGGRGGDVYG
jgi:hypothetical protein